jgi:hypothetical protein
LQIICSGVLPIVAVLLRRPCHARKGYAPALRRVLIGEKFCSADVPISEAFGGVPTAEGL